MKIGHRQATYLTDLKVSRGAIDIEKTKATRSLTARSARETDMATRQLAFEKGKKPW